MACNSGVQTRFLAALSEAPLQNPWGRGRVGESRCNKEAKWAGCQTLHPRFNFHLVIDFIFRFFVQFYFQKRFLVYIFLKVENLHEFLFVALKAIHNMNITCLIYLLYKYVLNAL